MPTVTSKDGTRIGYDAVGEGPAVIVVYGAAGYRGAFGDDGASETIMPFMRATAEALTTAIPHAEHQILPGQTHDVDPKAVAPVLTAFFQS